jgi:hypothetical protein
VSSFVQKSGDSMTGPLSTIEVRGVETVKAKNGVLYTRPTPDAVTGEARVKVANPVEADEAATKGYVDAIMGEGARLVAGTAVLSGGGTSDFKVPGLSEIISFYAINGDVGANAGQVTAMNPNNPSLGWVRLWHTFNGGAFRIYYIAVGR